MALRLTSQVVRTEGMMAAPVDQDIVILNMAGNNYISLDAIGRRIWELLETSIRVDELCRHLEREFAATEEQIAADVLPFLQELEKDGLVRVID
jgi:hypothetical protein